MVFCAPGEWPGEGSDDAGSGSSGAADASRPYKYNGQSYARSKPRGAKPVKGSYEAQITKTTDGGTTFTTVFNVTNQFYVRCPLLRWLHGSVAHGSVCVCVCSSTLLTASPTTPTGAALLARLTMTRPSQAPAFTAPRMVAARGRARSSLLARPLPATA